MTFGLFVLTVSLEDKQRQARRKLAWKQHRERMALLQQQLRERIDAKINESHSGHTTTTRPRLNNGNSSLT